MQWLICYVRATKIKLVWVVILSLVVLGCSRHRDLTEYTLDREAFDTVAMAKIEQETGFKLPDGTRGLVFHHIPPIDPIVFAKIQIPSSSEDVVAKQIEKFPAYNRSLFPENFANDRCEWWPITPFSFVQSKQTFNNGYYIEIYLIKEQNDLVLYIKYFTI